MTDVRPLGMAGVARIVALAGFAALSLVAAGVLSWLASGWISQANEFFQTANGYIDANDPAEQAAQRLSDLGYLTSNLVAPLEIAGLVAVFVIFAVLALHWARQHPLRP